MQQQAGVQLDLGCAPPVAHQGEKSQEKKIQELKDKSAQKQVRSHKVRTQDLYLLILDALILIICHYFILLDILLDLIGFNKLYFNFIQAFVCFVKILEQYIYLHFTQIVLTFESGTIYFFFKLFYSLKQK